MLRLQRRGLLFLVPALAYLVTVVGCGGDDKPKTTGSPPKNPPVPKTDGNTGPGTSSDAEASAVEAKGVATVKGKITFEGAPPVAEDLTPKMELIQDAKSKEHCKKGPTQDLTWIIGPDKGVANVVVWLKAPAGKYFNIPADQRTRTNLVTIDQPFCMFQPHVTAINPSDYDPQTKRQKKTGETFKVLNSAPIAHNTAYKGSNDILNPSINQNLSSGSEMVVDKVRPCKDLDFGKEELLSMNCDIHKWMTAKVAVFDHPYYAVTDKNGNYEIKNAPAGAELKLMYWHESMSPSSPSSLKAAKSKAVTLKEGENTENFTLSAK